MLQVTHAVQDKVLVVRLVGTFDGAMCQGFGEVLSKWLAEGGRLTMIDFCGVTYISSTGLKILLHHVGELRKIGGRLVLSAVHDSIFQVFEVGSFARLFEFADSLEEGLQLLAGAESVNCKGDLTLKS